MEKEGTYSSFQEGWGIIPTDHSMFFMDFVGFVEASLKSYIFIRDRVVEFELPAKLDLFLCENSYLIKNYVFDSRDLDSALRITQHSILLRVFTFFENWLKQMTINLILSNIAKHSPIFFKSITVNRIINATSKDEIIKKSLRVPDILKKYQSAELVDFKDLDPFPVIDKILEARNDAAHEYGKKMYDFILEHYKEILDEPTTIWDRFFDDFIIQSLVRCGKYLDKEIMIQINNEDSVRATNLKYVPSDHLVRSKWIITSTGASK